MEDKIETKIAEAEWFYDNVKPMTMQIFKLNYDFWFEMDDGYNDAGEIETLNQDGEQYVILNNCQTFKNMKEFPFFTCLSLEDAKSYAEKIVGQKLNWRS